MKAAAIGKTLGTYRVIAKLGEGGMGVVYLAEHPLLGSRAVVKQLHAELSSDREAVERFFNEAKAATRIKHRGIVSVFDFGYADDGSAYIAMEYLEGESLAARIQRLGAIRELDAIRVVRQIGSALSAAHQVGIIHRDLKPDNVFIVPDEEVAGGERAKVLDFGIAKLGGDLSSPSKTRTGAIMGSPLYMSPEQCRGGGDIDSRADIYSLGCVLFEMVCGRPPFIGQGVGEVIAKQIYEAPAPPSHLVAVSPGLDRLVLKALAKEPEKRQLSMRALLGELGELDPGRELTPLPIAAHMPRPPPHGAGLAGATAQRIGAMRPPGASPSWGPVHPSDPQPALLPVGPGTWPGDEGDPILIQGTGRRKHLAIAALFLIFVAGTIAIAVALGGRGDVADAVDGARVGNRGASRPAPVPPASPVPATAATAAPAPTRPASDATAAARQPGAATGPSSGPASLVDPLPTAAGQAQPDGDAPATAAQTAPADPRASSNRDSSRSSRPTRRAAPPTKKERQWGETVDPLADPD